MPAEFIPTVYAMCEKLTSSRQLTTTLDVYKVGNMDFIKKNGLGIAFCTAIAFPAWFLGKAAPVIGGPVIAILCGMLVTVFWKSKGAFDNGIKFVSKKVLQWAVVLLGFGLNYTVILQTGKQSLPIIVCTIAASLLTAFILQKVFKIPARISTLVGVGSSICGGSAVAATAPVIEASDEEVAQAISVIFFFNVLAALVFPIFGKLIGFNTVTGEAFGIFTGTAVNDTSSVTAAASTWDSMWKLGSQTLDKAVTVKLTRTLAIIPITFTLALMRTRTAKKSGGAGTSVSIKKIFPFFILYFIAASLITTIALKFGVKSETFIPLKNLSKFLIVEAMAAVGLNSDIVKLIKTGGKPLFLGAVCWIAITAVSLFMQHFMGIW